MNIEEEADPDGIYADIDVGTDGNDIADDTPLPEPAFIANDPCFFANLNHLRKDDPQRNFYVGPAAGNKGFRRWTPVHQTEIHNNIAGTYCDTYDNSAEPRVNWSHIEKEYNESHQSIALKYFLKFFPPKVWTSMIEGTNANLRLRKYKPNVTRTTLYKFLGIQLTKVLERPRGSVEDLFSQKKKGHVGNCRGGDYENRFNIKLNEHKTLLDNFRLRVPRTSDDDVEENDPWYQVRELIDEFNSNMVASFKPGKFIVVDEIMSAWKGLSGEFQLDGIPHQQKIARKPEGIGAEMKAAACGESGITLQLDIMEGAEAMKSKAFTKEYGSGCAAVLRLLAPWKYQNKVVIADSAFSSLLTLMALWCLYKTFFIGIVKTAHSFFPNEYFKNWFAMEESRRNNSMNASERGEWAVMTTTFRDRLSQTNAFHADPDYKVMAICWADRKAKCIISNWGNTRRCDTDIVRERSVVIRDENGELRLKRKDKTVMQPNVIHDFYKYFGTIDVNDHYRQGTLAIERNWLTKRWWTRIFQTVLGVIVTSAFYAYTLELRFQQDTSRLCFLDFVDVLCYELTNFSEKRVSRRSDVDNAPPVSDISQQNIGFFFSRLLYFSHRPLKKIILSSHFLNIHCILLQPKEIA